MKDQFSEIIGEFLQPISRLEHVTDALYLLRKGDSFVYTYGYCHPPGGLWGMIIYYPDSPGITKIFGREYGCTVKALVDGQLTLLPYLQKYENQFKADPGLDPNAPRPLFAKYRVEFPLSDFNGYFDDRVSIRLAMERYPFVKRVVTSVQKLLDVPLERLGVTGSLCYGKLEKDDIDLIFYGTVEENMETVAKIRSLTRRGAATEVFEYGKHWPIRFFNEGILICSFFKYSRRDEIPLLDFTMDLVRAGVSFKGRVTDDRHGMYTPLILELGDLEIDGASSEPLPVIIYDGSKRGEFVVGDPIGGTAQLVEVEERGKSYRALLIADKKELSDIPS